MVKLAWKSLAITIKKHKIVKAFTLFEVMVALAILAIALMASLVTTNSVMDKGLRLEEKIMAHWLAMNLINKAELKLFKDGLDISTKTGVDKMRNMEFKWRMEISKTKLQDVELLNINVEIFKNSDRTNNTIDVISRHVALL